MIDDTFQKCLVQVSLYVLELSRASRVTLNYSEIKTGVLTQKLRGNEPGNEPCARGGHGLFGLYVTLGLQGQFILTNCHSEGLFFRSK